jgi:hypothetical protein
MSDLNLTPPVAPDLDLPPERPTWPLVIGWISVSWAVIFGFCCMGMSVVGLAMMPMGAEQMAKQDPSADVTIPPMMQLGPAMITLIGSGVLLSVILLVAGAATIGRKPLGRTAHIAYGVLSILSVIASTAYQFYSVSQLQAFRLEHPNNVFTRPSPIGDYAGPIVGLVIGFVYPTFILIWFLASKRGKGPMDVAGPDIV